MTTREEDEARAALRVVLASLPGWEASEPVYDAEERLWAASAYAMGHAHGGAARSRVESRGMTRAEALLELAEALRRLAAPR